MSSMDIDKPLDEIISAKPRQRRARGGRGRSSASGGAASEQATGGARQRYAGSAPRSAGGRAAPATNGRGGAAKPLASEATKVIISNLPMDVTEPAVRDLMQSTVGPVRTVQMSYTSTGKSTGVATVLFKNKGDANKAHATYHNRMIDNQRPMKVEIAIDPNALQTLASRVAPVPAASGRKPAAGGAGGRRGGGAPRAPRAPRPAKKTAEDLDAEMSAYKTAATA